MGDYKIAPVKIISGVEQFDLCSSCAEQIKEFISSPEKGEDGEVEAKSECKREKSRKK